MTEADTAAQSATPAGTIVVGVDGSDSSKDALRWAARQAKFTGAGLRVVGSWHVPAMAYGSISPIPSGLDFSDAAREAMDDAITDVLGSDSDIDVVRDIVEGPPALELLKAAEGADLLVVGSRGHGAFAGMLLGSVSEHCVTHATCPVLVVRHKEK
jgi:nucleotide-binding universal stress UspA family protein